MSWWKKTIQNIFVREGSANLAKDRLQVILNHERVAKNGPDYLSAMRREIMEVIAKYTQTSPEEVKVDFEQHDGRSVLELNVVLPEQEKSKSKAAKAKTSKSKSKATSS